MNTIEKRTIGEYVAADFRMAALFSKHKIDFCCKGNKTLEEVCQAKGLNVEEIEKEIISALHSGTTSEMDYASFSPTLLIDYILEKHHSYIKEKTPTLLLYLDKLCKVHGDRHPELFEIQQLFQDTAGELEDHLQREEQILFPYIKAMDSARKNHEALPVPPFGAVKNPISLLKQDHEEAGEAFATLSELTHQYTPPTDACETYKVTFAMLREYEQDVHKHIHLENNLLFGKAKELETSFTL